MVDFALNTYQINGVDHDLDRVREYLLRTQEQLCKEHWIGSHMTKGKRIFTYDWYNILAVVEEAGHLKDFK